MNSNSDLDGATRREAVIRRYSEHYPENDTTFLLTLLDAERERTRAAVVRALRAMADHSYNYDDLNHYSDGIERRADAIENGADY